MKIAAIISEYNPFHNGHKYQLDQAKSVTDCDAIAVLMSGDFVQRGDYAIYPKKVRSDAALMCGADLILENPTSFVLRSAEGYAFSAVQTINSLNCADYLVFGAETESLTELKKIAELLVYEPTEFKNELKENLSKGLSFASARCNAIDKFLGKDIAKIISKPNNLLAVEYLKALIKLNSKIEPVLIKRIGAEHHSESVTNDIASASFIRSCLYDGSKSLKYVPKTAAELYKNASYFNSKTADAYIMSTLSLMTETEISAVPDISEGLENKIKKEIFNHNNFEDLIFAVKSKRYAYSRIRRALFCAALKITKTDFATSPKYIKILDFNDNGQKILNIAKKTSSLPLAKNASAILRNDEAMRLWRKELSYDRMYEILYSFQENIKKC